ncbi:MAG TPA: tripartite tricarboxylate transporter substrate binding protein [Ramlibacter sp.]|nr:tripartite tricarboxylate transporter substrate binding protein [Ramlibacter sp.]
MKRRLLQAGLAAAALSALLPAHAQVAPAGYPNRQIRLVVTGTPGQGTDVLSRLIAQRLAERLKQQVFVDNKPGAGGNIGADTVAKAPADGYTLLMATNATHAANAAMYAKMPFDPLKDFTPVAMVGSLPMMLSAAPAVPATSVRELVEAAKAQPGTLNVAIPSTSARVMLQLFNQLAKVDLFPVAYKGSGPAFTDLFGGRIQLTFDTVSASLPQAAAGKLKPLAVTTGRRFEAVPNVPTLAESGLPGFDLAPWNALVAPRGTPREIVSFLNAHVVAVLAEPDLRKRLVELGIQPQSGTPEQLDAFIQSEAQKWGDLVRQAKITAE